MFFKTVIYLSTAFIAIENAFAVLLVNKRSALNIIYCLMALDFAVSSIALCHISSAPSAGFCHLWFYINIPFGCIRSTLMLHFTMLLTENSYSKNKFIITLLYLSPLAFSVKIFMGDYFIPVFFISEWGWEPVMLMTSSLTHLLIVLFFIPSVISLIIFIHWRSTLNNGLHLQIAGRSIIPYMAGIAGIILCPYFWHLKGYDTLNMVMDISGQILFAGFIFSMRFSLRTLSFMKISSETTAGELITGINEPVFLVMAGGKIISYNKSGADLIDITRLEAQSSIYDIFDCPVTLKNIMENMFAGRIARSEVRCSISIGRDGRKSFILNIQSVLNQTGELTGVIVFVKEDPTIGEFKKQYSITDRQLDIILMVVTGVSNRQISEKLSIAEKTVENHLFNIYNKLGIENKIELFNIAQKYKIIPN
jgi:DNA-binding CsgD family transcriptional regulator